MQSPPAGIQGLDIVLLLFLFPLPLNSESKPCTHSPRQIHVVVPAKPASHVSSSKKWRATTPRAHPSFSCTSHKVCREGAQKTVCETPGTRTETHLRAHRTSLVSTSSVFLSRAATVVGGSRSCWSACWEFPVTAVGGCHCSCCGGPAAYGGRLAMPFEGCGGCCGGVPEGQ